MLLRLFGFLFDLVLLPLRLLLRLAGRGRPRPGSWLRLAVDGAVADVVERPRFWRLRPVRATSLHRLGELVDAMLADDRIRGLVVELRSLRAGMASATSFRALLDRARTGGKEVVVHLPMGGDTKEIYVATAATKIFLGPATQLAPLGFRSTAHYVKRALDRVGIAPEVYACGEFKSAGENLVRDSMSAEQRKQLDRLLETFHEALVDAIAAGRGVTHDRAAAIVDEAPYFGRAAVESGLADDVAYEDELPPKLGIERGKLLDAGAYLARAKRPLVRRLRRPPAIAVVRVHGAIAHAGGPLSEVSTDERVIRTIRAVRRARGVRAVILHVDSPGGSALASDRMHHEIAQLAREKPVVVCMANVAASGGYYVAAPAKRIVAEPVTVTGSIGVVAARLSLAPLLDRLGVTTEVVSRGAHAGLLGGLEPLSEAERAVLRRELDATYKQFVSVVAHGRSMPEADVELLARGRVYTGRDAHAVGLVDVLGGFATAVAEARALLPERDRARAEVIVARAPRSPVEPLDPPKQAAAALLDALTPPAERPLLTLLAHARGDRVFALAPIAET
jgi:protease-4